MRITYQNKQIIVVVIEFYEVLTNHQ